VKQAISATNPEGILVF